ncbi:1414_t:CDS:2, partial [Dentiscutata heterogama]
QRENDNNNFENNKETNKQLPDLQAISTDDQFLINNINQSDNECINDNQQDKNNGKMDKSIPNDQQSINIISGMLKQMTLANNSTQADDIGSIQDNDNEEDLDVSDDISPGCLECEDCYRNKRKCAHIVVVLCLILRPQEFSPEIGTVSVKVGIEIEYVKIAKKSTSHNDSSIDDFIENIPVVVIEKDEPFNNRQQINETEDMPVTQSDTNKVRIHNQVLTDLKINFKIVIKVIILQRSHSHNSIVQFLKVQPLFTQYNTLDEDIQSLQ